MQDRRTFARYPVRNPVIITPDREFRLLGTVTDMSIAGIAFEYVDFGYGELERSVEVDIFSPSQMLCLLNLSCTVVYNLAMINTPSFTSFKTRRFGLQFEGLSAHQMQQIESLLVHCKAFSGC